MKTRITSIVALVFFMTAIASLRASDWGTVRFTGKVTDSEGKPVKDATVLINQISGVAIGGEGMKGKELFNYIDSLKTLTDTNGAYDLSLHYRLTDSTNVRCELWFNKKQFVRVEKVVHFTPRDGIIETLDARLQQGLILSGVIRVPDIEDNPSLKNWVYTFEVTNKDFDDVFMTEKSTNGGAFTIFVPPGEYQIKLWDAPSVKFSNVKAGTTNLTLEPPPFIWSKDSVGKVFDNFWQVMNQNYSYFFLKTNVDWKALKDEYRPKAIQATNSDELAKVLQQMLAPLRDLHIGILTPHGELPSHISRYNFNGNGKATLQELAETNRIDHFAFVGRTKKDGFGYLVIARQSNANEENVKQVVAAIQKLWDVPGFIVDLRVANGGSEPLAQEIASQFCAKDTVYAKSKYRNGPSHNDFTEEYPRVLKASPNPYTKPVVCIIGPGTVSSGENFVQMMKCLPQVTTVGLPTRGASGNPQPYTLSGTGVTVVFSRWVDLMPDGQTFEEKGISPDVIVNEPSSAYEQQDPTLEKALEILRQKIAVK
jgi:Peptidase family S41/Tricorn protease C1 domain